MTTTAAAAKITTEITTDKATKITTKTKIANGMTSLFVMRDTRLSRPVNIREANAGNVDEVSLAIESLDESIDTGNPHICPVINLVGKRDYYTQGQLFHLLRRVGYKIYDSNTAEDYSCHVLSISFHVGDRIISYSFNSARRLMDIFRFAAQEVFKVSGRPVRCISIALAK